MSYTFLLKRRKDNRRVRKGTQRETADAKFIFLFNISFEITKINELSLMNMDDKHLICQRVLPTIRVNSCASVADASAFLIPMLNYDSL